MIAAIVLAAGKSERMGRPKALLRLQGRTFLEHIVNAIERSAIARSIVVAGHHRQAIEAEMPPGVEAVFNPDYDRGMTTSIQAGIRGLQGAAAAAVFLVDHPLIRAETIDHLIRHLQPGRIVLPIFNGRRGHPALFAAELFEEILAIPDGLGLNSVVRRDPGRVIEVAVDDPGILRDIDTPADFAGLLGEDR